MAQILLYLSIALLIYAVARAMTTKSIGILLESLGYAVLFSGCAFLFYSVRGDY